MARCWRSHPFWQPCSRRFSASPQFDEPLRPVYEYTPFSRKYSEKFKFAFMSLIATPGLSVRQRSAREPAPTTRGSMMMKFALFLALGIAALAIIAALATGGENGP